MKKRSYLRSLALFITSIAFANTSFTQTTHGGRTSPGDTFGTYTFEQKFISSGGTVFHLSYGCDDIDDAIDGIESQYDSCTVVVDTVADAVRHPITKFQYSYSVPSLGNAGEDADDNGGQDSIEYVQMLHYIVDSGQVYMKEKERDSCDNVPKLEKLVYEIRCYKPDDFVTAKWMADARLFQQKRGPHPGPQPANLLTDSMTVTQLTITITCVCPDTTETDTSVTVPVDESGYYGVVQGSGLTDKDLLIYPNPANSTINFVYPSYESDGTSEIEVVLNVFNAYGQLIESVNVMSLIYGENNLQLDLNNYSPGLYFYSMSVGQEIFKGQFVKN